MGDALADFLDWYALYPKKVARAAAQKAWNRLTLPERQQAIDALPAHVHRWRITATPWEFLPHPASWLNQQRFADELPNNGGGAAGDSRRVQHLGSPPPPINGPAAPHAPRAPLASAPASALVRAVGPPVTRLSTGPKSIGDVIADLKRQIGVK